MLSLLLILSKSVSQPPIEKDNKSRVSTLFRSKELHLSRSCACFKQALFSSVWTFGKGTLVVVFTVDLYKSSKPHPLFLVNFLKQFSVLHDWKEDNNNLCKNLRPADLWFQGFPGRMLLFCKKYKVKTKVCMSKRILNVFNYVVSKFWIPCK